MAEFYRKKKKVCYLCTGKTFDYKDVDILKKYINDKVKYYQDVLLELALNIKDISQLKLKEHVLSHYYHIQNNCY